MRRAGWSRRHALAALLAVGGRVGARDFQDPLRAPAPGVGHPSRASLAAIARAGAAGHLVAVGARGLVIVSEDGGQAWWQAPMPLSADLVAVRFVDPALGWIAGHDGLLLRSADGGASWTRRLDGLAVEAQLRAHFEQLAARHDARADSLLKQLAIDHANGPEQPFLDVAFDAAGRGFASGAFGLLLGSDDGGARWQSWIERIDNPRGLHLNALHCAADAWLIASEQGTVFRLGTGELHFSAVPTGYGGSLFAITGDARRIIACGLRGAVLESTDQGRSWRGLVSGSNASFSAATWLEDGRLALANQSGQLILSRRDGPGFDPPRRVSTWPLTGVVQSGEALVAVGPGGVCRMSLS